MWLTHALAQCRDCDKRYETMNAMRLAAQHHKLTGHKISVECCYAHHFPVAERSTSKADGRRAEQSSARKRKAP